MQDCDGDHASGLSSLKGRRVLLAEDNITNQMVATQMLDALGMRVDVANDGAEALEMIERRHYDLYLIDIEMPRVSGLDVIRGIRKSPPPLAKRLSLRSRPMPCASIATGSPRRVPMD